jgi:hypothetical protein
MDRSGCYAAFRSIVEYLKGLSGAAKEVELIPGSASFSRRFYFLDVP